MGNSWKNTGLSSCSSRRPCCLSLRNIPAFQADARWPSEDASLHPYQLELGSVPLLSPFIVSVVDVKNLEEQLYLSPLSQRFPLWLNGLERTPDAPCWLEPAMTLVETMLHPLAERKHSHNTQVSMWCRKLLLNH